MQDSVGTGKIDHTYNPGSTVSEVKQNRNFATIQLGIVNTYTSDKDIDKDRYNDTTKFANKAANTTYSAKNASFTMSGGTIKSQTTSIVSGDKSTINITGGTIESSASCGLYYGDRGNGGSSFTMSGGTIKTTGALPPIQVGGMIGTETTSGTATTINIKGDSKLIYDVSNTTFNGTEYLKGNNDVIYNGGLAKITIEGNAKLVSTNVGIEHCTGTLTVKDNAIIAANATIDANGNITQTKETGIEFNGKSTSASTDKGVGIVVDQYGGAGDYAKTLSVVANIEGGTISGSVALAVTNPKGHKLDTGIPNVTVSGGTLKSTSSATTDSVSYNATGYTDENGKLSALYTVTGKNAIFNGDTRATITLKKATIEGSIAAITEGRTGENTTGYNIGEGNTFSNFTFPDNSELVSFYQVTGNDENFAVNVLGANQNWNIKNGAENTWVYIVSSGAGDANVASLAPDSSNANVLKLTTGSGNATIPLDLNETTFASLTSFTTLNASAATNNFALNITGNDYLTSIVGGAGADSLKAGVNGATLDGGAGNDSLIAVTGTKANTFLYQSGKDTIDGYTYGTDIVSLTGSDLTLPTEFSKAVFDSSNFNISLGSGDTNVLVFKATSNVAIGYNNATYTYTSKSIALDKADSHGISLGAGWTSDFNGTKEAYENYATIDAAEVEKKIQIRGNDNANYIVGGTGGGTLLGGDNNDTIIAGGGSTTLNGEDGNDVLQGGSGKDLFFYTAGTDSIGNYSAANGDLITVRGVNLAEATVSKDTSNLILTFDSSNALSIAGGAVADATKAISIQSGKNVYTYTKDYYALNDKSVTLMSGHTSPFDGSEQPYTTINAAQANEISILGNASGNYIVGGTVAGGTLNGGDGDDKLVASDRGENAKYLFEYTAGKDEVLGFSSASDTVDITPTSITAAKASSGKLTFTIDKNNSLVLKSDDDIATVSLNGGGYLTKDGYVKDANFKLFSSAKGRIELTSELYSGASISSLNAESVKDQSVTLVGGTQGGAFYYAANNKQKDGFEYGGGNVTISGYEGGRDKIDLGAYSFGSFAVVDDNVSISTDGGTISLLGAKGKEVLVHDATKSNIYQKMVFVETGIVQTKVSKPTAAVISSTLSSDDNTYTAPPTVKKVTIDIGGVKVKAGNSKNTILDASNATTGVSLEGGKKNDKLIGGAGDDLFIYTGGKDIINGYGAGDSISFDATSFDIDSAKITASNKSIKFKFSNKNTLTIKGEGLSSLNVNGETRTYFKNAIADGGAVSLTGAFSGTFSTAGTNIATVDGHLVTKNLTFKGTDAAETLIGGGKKNMFKGGGGADSLVGGNATDTFFYAKNDTGNATIANFDYGKDKLKVASGKISGISAADGNVTFSMADGSFKVENNNLNDKKVAIRANNTYYWFADENATDDSYEKGALITSDKRITAGDVSGFAVIDLNYSTNLVKANVAFKVTGATPNKTTT